MKSIMANFVGQLEPVNGSQLCCWNMFVAETFLAGTPVIRTLARVNVRLFARRIVYWDTARRYVWALRVSFFRSA